MMIDNGYRLITDGEFFMSLALESTNKIEASPIVNKANTINEFEWINSERNSDYLDFDNFNENDISIYYIRNKYNLLAWARLIHVNRTFIIDDVATVPEFRRKGLSELLIKTVISEAFMRKGDRIVLASTGVGRYLYEKVGFKVIFDMSVYKSKL